jgi:DNA (cytosine-5)-methyltransferase 1
VKLKADVGRLNFIDLFAGAGGFSCGLEMAGHKCLLGVDNNKHAMETFKVNHPNSKVFCGDIRELKTKQLKALVGDTAIDLVVGGPPCQGFSTVGPGNPEDERNSLFLHFCRVVRTFKPKFVVMENVTGLLAKKNEKTLMAIYQVFWKMGYQINVKVLSASQYKVPEKRRRTIFIASSVNKAVSFPKPISDFETSKKSYPPITVGEAFSNLYDQKGELHNHDLDLAQLKTKLDAKRLAKIPEGRGIRYQKDEKELLPPRLRLEIDWDNLPENRFRQTKYQRLDRKRPSPTIMTHRHTYYHPVELRYLTVREAAAIQSFPNNFVFKGPLSAQWRQVGNAVPPMMAKEIGKHLKFLAKNQDFQTSRKRRKFAQGEIEEIRSKAFVYRVIS